MVAQAQELPAREKAEPGPLIPPSIGRAVLYYPFGSATHADGGTVIPRSAHVAFVWSERLINIGFIDHNGVAGNATGVRLVQPGDEIPEGPFCRWMPFTIDREQQRAREMVAAKHAADTQAHAEATAALGFG